MPQAPFPLPPLGKIGKHTCQHHRASGVGPIPSPWTCNSPPQIPQLGWETLVGMGNPRLGQEISSRAGKHCEGQLLCLTNQSPARLLKQPGLVELGLNPREGAVGPRPTDTDQLPWQVQQQLPSSCCSCPPGNPQPPLPAKLSPQHLSASPNREAPSPAAHGIGGA